MNNDWMNNNNGTQWQQGTPTPTPGYAAPPPAPPPAWQPQNTRPPQRPASPGFQVPQLVVSLCLLILIAGPLLIMLTIGNALKNFFAPAPYITNPPANSFSVITVYGTIENIANDPYSTYAPSYYHGDTLSHIEELADNDNNAGILLYMDTPGGGVFESDEVYRALMDYKEKTQRPVWAYMSATCASGGYYICAAADKIVCDRNTTTGSIGVYIALVDTSGLFDKLGIETVLVRSGDNKGVGMSGVPITESQREVYQDMVDEHYETFITLVAEGRGLPLEEVRKLADGRVYTGTQALNNKLVDEIGEWDDVLTSFENETGANAFYPSFGLQSQAARMAGGFLGSLPQSDAAAALAAAENQPAGVPMALYQP